MTATWLRGAAVAVLVAALLASLGASWLAPASYETQFRADPLAPPSEEFPLGTDDLGRDRLSRLLYGSRVSLLLAPPAAILSTLLAAAVGILAGALGGWWERLAMAMTDLFLSLPWLFLLLTVRATLPLNASPEISILITFALLGWAASARVVRSRVREILHSDFLLQARAAGCSGLRILWRHVLPNLNPILLAQFWIAVPLFLLSEANLGLLGLGVAEPLPSWGNLLRELEDFGAVASNPWMLAPAAILLVVVSCFQLILPGEDSRV